MPQPQPQETGETSQYDTSGLVTFDTIPPSFRKFGNWMDQSEYEYYANKVIESDGFDVSGCTGVVCDGIVELNDTTEVIPAARFAVNQHNAQTGATLKFLEVARANFQALGVVFYYITLKAVDEQNNGPRKLYRAKVRRHRINILNGQTEADRKYTLVNFYESPQQTLKRRPRKPKSSKRKIRPAPGHARRSRRPFYKFVAELKTFDEHYDSPYYDVVKLAKKEWESLSPKEKDVYAK